MIKKLRSADFGSLTEAAITPETQAKTYAATAKARRSTS